MTDICPDPSTNCLPSLHLMEQVLSEPEEQVVVCIVTRFYASMVWQLRQIGFYGDIRKLVDYNTYAEYSLSCETIEKKKKRIELGKHKIKDLKRSYPSYYRIFVHLQRWEMFIFVCPLFLIFSKGYTCYTNVVGNEMPLPGTIPISPPIDEIQSLVEWEGSLIGWSERISG